jgi:pimeloyl-ACP methyl ester carboxylesterase
MAIEQVRATLSGMPCQVRQSVTGTSPATPPLAEILERFAREAEHGHCDTGRYRCPYHVWGEQGPPLLFIPGLADDAHSFVQVMVHLTEGFRCIAYDLPAGRTDGARLWRYTHANLVADAFALLDHLGVRESYLFGSSFGGTIALEALRAGPERLPRAMLQGSFARRPLTWAENLLVRLIRRWPGTMRYLPLRKAALHRANYPFFADRRPELWEYFLERSNVHPVAAVAHRALIVHYLDLRSILPDIHQPVLLVGGDRDLVIARACEEELLHGLPNVRRVELFNCGHNPLFTHPEVLAQLIRGFFTPPCPELECSPFPQCTAAMPPETSSAGPECEGS